MPKYENSYSYKRNQDRQNQSYALVPYGTNQYYVPNWTPGATSTPSASKGYYANSANSLGSLWNNFKTKFQGLPGGGKGTLSALTNPNNYAWNKASGIQAFGKNLGKGANIASGIIQGAQAINNWNDYQDIVGSNEDLLGKIEISALGNPLLSQYLTAEQLDLLGDVRQNRYSEDAGFNDFTSGVREGIPEAIPSALMGFVSGGIPGAIIGGAGSLLNSGIQGMSNDASESTAELQALYQALQDADAQYRSMRRPNFTGLGIQQQYRNMYA